MGDIKYYELIQGNQIFIFKGKEYLDPRKMCIELNTLDSTISSLEKENQYLKEKIKELTAQKEEENDGRLQEEVRGFIGEG